MFPCFETERREEYHGNSCLSSGQGCDLEKLGFCGSNIGKQRQAIKDFNRKKSRAEDAKLAKSSEVEESTLVVLTFAETNPVTDATWIWGWVNTYDLPV